MVRDIQRIVFDSFSKHFNDDIFPNKELNDYLKKLKKEKIYSSLIIYIMSCGTVDEIVEFFKMKEQSKKVIINYLVENLEDICKQFITFLSDDEVIQFKYIMKNNGYLMYDITNDLESNLSIGIIVLLKKLNIGFVSRKNNMLQIHIPESIVNIIKKNIDDFDLVKKRENNNKIYNYSIGVLEAYGTISIDYLYELYIKQVKKIDEDEFVQILHCKSCLDEYIEFFRYENQVILSILPEEDFNLEYENKYIDYYKYSYNDFMDMQKRTYIKQFNSYKRLRDYLKEEWGLNNEMLDILHDGIIMEYLRLVQIDEELALDNLRMHLKEYFEFDNFNQEITMFNMIKSLKYDYPIWKLKGNKLPRETKKNSKIGRNDHCPCGSGKKYKRCCGKQ